MFSRFFKTKRPNLGDFTCILHDNGYFLVRCKDDLIVFEILNGGNAMLGKRPVLIRKWNENFNFKSDILKVVMV